MVSNHNTLDHTVRLVSTIENINTFSSSLKSIANAVKESNNRNRLSKTNKYNKNNTCSTNDNNNILPWPLSGSATKQKKFQTSEEENVLIFSIVDTGLPVWSNVL